MRWRKAFVIMRKDLDEFKKQKLVIGSILAMPVVLGVILPGIMFAPIITLSSSEVTWDVDGLIEIGQYSAGASAPWVNGTIENQTFEKTQLSHLLISNCSLSNVVLDNCVVNNSFISNATILGSSLTNTTIEQVAIIHSSGQVLDGENIFSINSNLMFTKTKESDVMMVLPTILNMVLMIFIIVPATLPTIIATYSIVGEKNNRSLEPLLATPITDGEILAGKILSSFIPSMLSTWFAFSLGVGVLSWLFFSFLGSIPIPGLSWFLAVVVLAPTACIMSILACVLISSKVSDVRAAQQAGGFMVMPVVILMLGVLSGIILVSPLTILAAAGVYALIDLGLFYFARSIFNREDILVKWK